MSRPFAAIGFTVFFTIALLFKFSSGVTVAALIVFSVALVVALLNKSLRNGRVVPVSAASAVLACLILLMNIDFLYTPAISYKGKTCDISAVLTSEPEFEYGNCYYIAEITQIDSEDVDLKIRLVFSGVPDAEPYDIVNGKFTFYIPGESNEASLSSNVSSGIFIAAYPNEDDYEFVSVPESDKPFGKKIIDIRTKIKNSVYRILPNEYGALAVALLIGDKSGLSAETLNNFNFIGISHIICVSGYHLSLWTMLFYELLRKTKLGIRLSSFICIFPVVLFMFISGMTYSVIRAGVMTVVYLLSNVMQRKRDPLNSLGFALMLIAVFNPFAMGSASLQLSAMAAAGIIIYSEKFAPAIDDKINGLKNIFIRRFIRSAVSVLSVTVAATAFTLPVSLSLYNRFNFMVFAANIIAVPVSGFCMILCTIGALIGCFTTEIINVPAYFGGIFSKFLVVFSEKLSEIRMFSFNIESDETSVIIISLFLICFLSLLLAYYGKSFPRLTCFICCFVFVVLIVTFSLSDRDLTKVRVVDCGNGTSVVLSKRNECIVIGCGGTEFLGSYNLCNALYATGNNPNALFYPEPEEKSSEYFSDLLKEYRPEEIYCYSITPETLPLVEGIEVNPFNRTYNSSDFKIISETINGKSFSFINNEDISVLILFDRFEDVSLIPEKYMNSDIIVTRNDYPVGIENINCLLTVLNAENSRGMVLQKELTDKGVYCAATAGCGDIIIKADDGHISSYRED